MGYTQSNKKMSMDEVISKLDELETLVSNSGENQGTIIKVQGFGCDYNTTFDSKVITSDQDDVISIDGKGRLLFLLPICNGPSASGTVQVMSDGVEKINKKIIYSGVNASRRGYSIIDVLSRFRSYGGSSSSDNHYTVDDYIIYATDTSSSCISEDSSFNASFYKDIRFNKDGLYFDEKLQIKGTHANTDTTYNKYYGFLAVYELFE